MPDYMKRYITKGILSLSCVFVMINCIAQEKYKTSKTQVSFFSKTPVENIEAVNKSSKGIIDFNTKAFLVKIPIKSFDFPSDLMEEHFNENYLESDKYPDATFKGTFEGDYDLKKDGNYPVNANGDLTIHGVTQKRSIPCTLKVVKGNVTASSKFNVKLVDHKIEVPQLVFNKIAEVIEVTADLLFVKIP
jgi:polyisoprenoid-binding protein YceI